MNKLNVSFAQFTDCINHESLIPKACLFRGDFRKGRRGGVKRYLHLWLIKVTIGRYIKHTQHAQHTLSGGHVPQENSFANLAN